MWMYIILPVAIFTFIAGVGGGIVGVLGYIFGVLILRAILPKEMNEALRFFLAYIVPIGIGFLIENLAGGAVRGILPTTGPQLWGGLLLTLLLTAVGIVGALPIGIGLALGRRSHLPVVRTACTLYIELVRGVPLITVLFMSMLLVPFVVPAWGGPTTAPYRAMVAVTLFSAAYLAENVRGGLQSLPPGQEEAGKALGLSNWQVIRFITMPQALRAVIPALVGQFIALYKDTSLVAIVGLIDLTGIANSVVAQPAFLGLRRETYLFISVIYFAFSYVMSILSRRLEESGSGAARR
jgi:general L-amino acid transport system permease protein